MSHPRRRVLGALAVVFAGLGLAAPSALAETKVQVRADAVRVQPVSHGEAARADGHVTITIPGEVRIEAPSAQLLKGKDGQLAYAVFPSWVRVTDLRPSLEGRWKSEHNKWGRYDFRTRQFTEIAPDGVFEVTPKSSGPAASDA